MKKNHGYVMILVSCLVILQAVNLIMSHPECSEGSRDSSTLSQNDKVPPPKISYTPKGEIYSIKTRSKVVYLTFDDSGSRPFVTSILETLKKNQVKAVFFLTANEVGGFPDLVARMKAEGHKIGNHTANHRWLTKINFEAAKQEIVGMENLLISKGINPKPYFRFPGGFRNGQLIQFIEQRGYRSFMWSFDSMGYRKRSVADIVGRFENQVRPGTITLLHLHANSDVQALPALIQKAREMGYTFGLL